MSSSLVAVAKRTHRLFSPLGRRNHRCVAVGGNLSTPTLQTTYHFLLQRDVAADIESRERRRHRWQSSASNDSDDDVWATPDIPEPTWSVANLRLKSDDNADGQAAAARVSEKELLDLAYRCLIDVRTFPKSERDQLRQDLAGIMRCVSVVSDASSRISESEYKLGPEDLYDAFRGQYQDGAPLRNDENACGDDWSGKEEAERIVQSAVDSGKDTVRVEENGEVFFSVVTGRTKKE